MLSCLVAVLAMFLAIISPSSFSWKKWNVRHFCFHNQNNSTIVPRSSRLAESASGQDEANPAFLLAPTCKSSLFGDILCWPSYGWILASFCFFAFLLTSTSSRPKETQKKRRNSANIQPSWPHAWSITHMYAGWNIFHSIYMSDNRAVVRLKHFIKGSVRLKLYYTIVIYIIPLLFYKITDTLWTCKAVRFLNTRSIAVVNERSIRTPHTLVTDESFRVRVKSACWVVKIKLRFYFLNCKYNFHSDFAMLTRPDQNKHFGFLH